MTTSRAAHILTYIFLLQLLQVGFSDTADFAHQYIGCYVDNVPKDNRVMSGAGYTGLPIPGCRESCMNLLRTFFGLEWYAQCFCGDQYDRLGELTESSCNTSCSGDETRMCGGADALSVFWVCPIGFHGTNCTASCHCQNSTRYKSAGCFINGTCPSGCQAGWSGTTCSNDVAECKTSIHGCQHTCTNTMGLGSYQCSCWSVGYVLDTNGKTCTDIDECIAATGGCQHNCTNTPGSHYCSCMTGYALNADNRTCTDTDECTTQTHGCEQVCHNIPGSYTCSCRQGYLLNTDGRTCAEIDECLSANHGCQHNCTNTPGSYRCSCRPGFSLDSTGRICGDIDECATNVSVCLQQKAVCVNTVGSFRCLFESSEIPIQHTDKWPSGAVAAAIILGAAWLITLIIAVIVIAILVSKRRGNQNAVSADHVSQIYDTVDGETENTAGAKTIENDNSYTEFTGSAVRMDKQEHAYEGLKM